MLTNERLVKKLEKKIQDTERAQNLYQTIFESTGTATLIVNEDMTIEKANKEIAQITGYEPEELTGRKWTDFVAPDSLELMMKYHILRRTHPSEAPKKYEVTLIHKSGLVRNAMLDIGVIPGTTQSIVSILDITHRVKSENALRLSERKFSLLFENSPFSIILSSLDNGVLLAVNRQFEKAFGFSRQEAIGKTTFELGINRSEGDRQSFLRMLKEHKHIHNREMKLYTKTGEERDFLVNIDLLEINNTVFILNTAGDITDKKLTENRYMSLVNNLPVGIIRSTPDGKLISANPAMLDIYGYQSEEELYKTPAENVYVDVSDRVQLLKILGKTDALINYISREKRKDGTLIWVSTNYSVTRDQKGNIKYIDGVVVDITQRKEIEEKLKQTTDLLNETEKITVTGGWEYDVKNKRITWTDEVYQIYGVNKTEYDCNDVNKNFSFYSEGDDKRINEAFRKAVDEGIPYNFELNLTKANGDKIWVRTSGKPLKKNGEIVKIIGHITDITELKEAEKDLEESEARFSAFMNTLPITTFIKDKDQKLLFVNTEMKKVFKANSWIGKTPYDIFPRDVAQKLIDADMKSLTEGYNVNVHTVPDRDGHERIWETHTFRIDRSGDEPLLGGFSLDITDRKKAQENLQRREKFHEIRAELWKLASDTGYTECELIQNMLTEVGKALDVSRSTYLEINPNKRKYDLKYQWYHPDAGPSKNISISYIKAKLLFGREHVSLPDELIPGLKQYVTNKFKKDNILSYLAYPFGNPRDPKGLFTFAECRKKRQWDTYEIAALNEVVKIINFKSSQIEAYKALVDSEKLLAEAQKLGKIGSWEFNVKTGEITWSGQTYRLYERDPKLGPPTNEEEAEYYSPDQAKMLREYAATAIRERKSFEYDITLKLPGKKIVYCHATLQPIIENDETVILRGTVQDITKRKIAENKLQISEKKYRDIITLAPIGFYQSSRNGDFILVNDTLARMLEYKNAEEMLGNLKVRDIYYEKGFREKLKAQYNVDKKEDIRNVEVQFKRKDGSPLWVLLTHHVNKNDQVYYDGFVMDISKLIDAENKIKQSLHEKETLLRELYHRTKNNMQVIISMLKMQARQIGDESLTNSYREIINRINAISLVHQKLYKAQDLSKINLKDYIKDITYHLVQTYADRSLHISLDIDLQDVDATIDVGYPLGLVITELISNIYKHAYPDGGNGILKITLRQDMNGMIVLELSDNGAGVPQDFELTRSDSMGLKTVYNLVEYQLKGTIKFENEHGLKWIISFNGDIKNIRV